MQLSLRRFWIASSSFWTMSYNNTAAKTVSALVAPATSLDLAGSKGEFTRSDALWRNWIKADDTAEFPAQAGRYHLYLAYACPWAHRTLMARAIKGLEGVISTSFVHPTWQRSRPDNPDDLHAGWTFVSADAAAAGDGTTPSSILTNYEGRSGPLPALYSNNHPDPFGNAKFVRDIYERASKDGYTGGVYSVPILWDTVKNTIVSNESSEILRMLNSEFNAFSKYPELDLYAEDFRSEIDAVNEWVYPSINNGVYRCGFAKTQEAYDEAIVVLTNGFDRVDSLLQKQRYIAGDRFTEADIRLFVTLLRFDEVYVVYFKCNTRSVEQSDAILNYCREIYQMHGVKETVDMKQIKAHYYTSHPNLNYYSIIPKGRDFCQLLEQPHNRDKL